MDIPLLPITPRDADEYEDSLDTIQVYEDVTQPVFELYPDEIPLDCEVEEVHEDHDYLVETPIFTRERNIRTAWTTDEMIDKVVDQIIKGQCILKTLHQIRLIYKRADKNIKLDTKCKIRTAVKDKVTDSQMECVSKTLDNYFN